MDDHCQPACPTRDCPSVFELVAVRRITVGGSLITWELMDSFKDPAPLQFQLQVGRTSSNDSDDWEDVGLPVTNQYYAIDGEQRNFGKTNDTFYRIELSTNQGVYYSDPVGIGGILSPREWRIVREIIRKEKLRGRYFAACKGYLLKRRRTGDPCPTCLDYQLDTVRNESCPDCYGTGLACGYYYPIDCVYAEMSPRIYRTALDPQRGTVNDIIIKARMLNTVLLNTEDLWVNAKTDDRFFVQTVRNIAEVRDVPVVAEVELRLARYTHVVYDIQVPQQLEELDV